VTDVTASALTAALRDRYRLEREVGRGGMATVYLAEDVRHRRQVAVKVLRAELASGLGPERFQREVCTTAHLQHPHILPVLDSGNDAGQLWYTMPYVRGESLRDRLQREGQLPLDAAIELTRQVALALDYAHREGVIHRDLKPENILLADGQALVADFGVAKALNAAGEGQLTETGLALGTPAYMSPEQAMGGAVDARSDIYAMACVLYEMLAGEPPFTGLTPQAVIAKRMLEPVPHVRTLRETVPETVEQVLTRALAKAPADRFPTAAEFAQALSRAMTSRSETLTAPAAVPGAIRRRVPRATLGLGIAALVILAIIAAAILGSGRKAPPALDRNLVVIAPFDVLDPKLQLWREGLVDLLARNLDGAGPLRTVSPTTVVRRWRGRADRASASALAGSVSASLALYGTLVSTGADSVRLTARMLDVARGEVISETDIRGTAARLDQLADSLTVSVLRDLAQTREIGAARSSGIGSRSLPALRAFLRGEQFFRRTEWDSARTSYERAIALDSAFALAYWRLGSTRGWQFGVGDSLALELSRHAGVLNQGLPPRESLLIAFDSLMSTISEMGLPDSATRQDLRRLFRTSERATKRYPNDPESWVALGEARYHYGEGLGVSDEMKLAAFGHAIALDSSYAPAYIHAVELALRLNNSAEARRYLARYLALRSGGEDALAARVTSRILDTTASAATIQQMLDTTPGSILWRVWDDFMFTPDSSEIAISIARELAKPEAAEELYGENAWFGQGLLAGSLDYRGHLRESARIVMAQHRLAPWALFVELALAGAIPADTADAFYLRRLRREPFWSESDKEQEGLNWALPWWAARNDSAALKRFLERTDEEGRSKGAPSGPVRGLFWKTRGQAYLALVRRDTAAALSGLRALPDSSRGPVWLDRLTLAQLLAAGGREREALAVLDRELPHNLVTGTHGPWALERARLAEKVGEKEKARYWYGYVLALWRHADPELRSAVAEAREALGRLAGEIRR
jgi:serine/threonine-protein kinase